MFGTIEGERVTFLCSSYGETKWFHGGLTTEVISTHRKLEFIASRQNAGIYYCHGLSRKKGKHFIAKSFLSVYGKFVYNHHCDIMFRSWSKNICRTLRCCVTQRLPFNQNIDTIMV